MHHCKTLLFLLILLALLSKVGTVYGGLEDFFKDIQKYIKTDEISENRIIEGLKEALEIGTANAVKVVSKVNGYYDNKQIRIPLPENVKKVEGILDAVGYGPKLDEFERSMNRAAENAAPHAKALFWDSIKGMRFADARRILDGRENEATVYFEEKTRERLTELFKPLVNEAMSEVGVTHTYQKVDDKIRSMPFTEALQFDLDQYVTDQALDGLFFMLAKEELKIREDPAARVTELLKDVFGRE